MTVSSAVNKVSFNGNGSQTVFAYSFKIFDQDDLTVILRNASGGETTQTISCLLYTSPSPRDKRQSRMPSSA